MLHDLHDDPSYCGSRSDEVVTLQPRAIAAQSNQHAADCDAGVTAYPAHAKVIHNMNTMGGEVGHYAANSLTDNRSLIGFARKSLPDYYFDTDARQPLELAASCIRTQRIFNHGAMAHMLLEMQLRADGAALAHEARGGGDAAAVRLLSEVNRARRMLRREIARIDAAAA